MFYVLKSSDVLDVLVPILYHLNDARADQCEYEQFIEIYKYGIISIHLWIDWLTAAKRCAK